MRLIDADALADFVAEDGMFAEYLIDYIVNHIIAKQPVIDAVPVVRCKDCKYSRQPNRKDYYENRACEGVLICVNCPDTVRPEDGGYKFVYNDWFCSDREKKVSE